MDDIKEEAEAKIECCDHKFCFDCINNWATKSENSCPLCKKKFNKIFYLDSDFKDLTAVVPDKSNIAEDEAECLICDEVIYEDQHYAICDVCEETAVH